MVQEAYKQLPFPDILDCTATSAIRMCTLFTSTTSIAFRMAVDAGGRHIVSIYKQCSIYGDWRDGYNLNANNPNVAMACIGIDVDRVVVLLLCPPSSSVFIPPEL